jgi:structure-specific endonuclease subunit SLX1
MLHTPPWNRLALNIRWLKQDWKLDFPTSLAPPTHIPVVFGPVQSKKIPGKRGMAIDIFLKPSLSCAEGSISSTSDV